MLSDVLKEVDYPHWYRVTEKKLNRAELHARKQRNELTVGAGALGRRPQRRYGRRHRASRKVSPDSCFFPAAEALESLPCFGPLPCEKRGHAKHDTSHPLCEGKGERDIAADTQDMAYRHQ